MSREYILSLWDLRNAERDKYGEFKAKLEALRQTEIGIAGPKRNQAINLAQQMNAAWTHMEELDRKIILELCGKVFRFDNGNFLIAQDEQHLAVVNEYLY